MRQVVENLGTGCTGVADIPAPASPAPAYLTVRTATSLISAGTERMLVEFGKAGWLQKARQQPDKVRMVLEKVRTDGLLQTVDAVRSKLDQPLPLGYSAVGTVVAVGEGVDGFALGDRVVCNGPHAEVVTAPVNLCARVPDGVSDVAAAFTILGSIGLQGMRLAQPTLGESFVVTGLGLIGLLTVQLLRAQGCRVLGMDTDPGRVALAREFGAEGVDLAAGEDPVAAAHGFSRGRGVDGVLITASTKSSAPVHQAAQMCRKRGRIVLVGVTGLELSRADFYEKELSFQVSCSYGPGRYDPAYEEKGQDYPAGFVRWTAQRNFEAVLDLLDAGRVAVEPLLSHRFPFAEAEQAYTALTEEPGALGILLEYADETSRPTAELLERTVAVVGEEAGADRQAAQPGGEPGLAVIGAGNYASRMLIPALQRAGARFQTVATTGGVSGAHVARKFGFGSCTTDLSTVFGDPAVTAVAIATRHDSHAHLTCDALAAGKAVFVEKPLALTLDEVAAVETALHTAGPGARLMVGFNRRFAPQVVKAKALLDTVCEPKAFVMMVNAGEIPADHWTQDPAVGGGRILGEACHFIDLLRFLTGSPIAAASACCIGGGAGTAVRDDKAMLSLRFGDGSIGSIHYLANGHRGFPKERLEVFTAGRVLQLDNFRVLRGYGWPGFRSLRLRRQDKGHGACAAAFLQALRQGSEAPIPAAELFEVARVTVQLAEELRG